MFESITYYKFMCLSSFLTMAFIAQATPHTEVNSLWVSLIRDLGSFGVVIFLVYWGTTKIIPQLQNQYIDANAAQRKEAITAIEGQRKESIIAIEVQRTENSKSLEAQRTAYLDAIKQQRQDFLEALRLQRTEFAALRVEERAFQERNIEASEAMIKSIQLHTMEAHEVWRARGDLTPEVIQQLQDQHRKETQDRYEEARRTELALQKHSPQPSE